MGAVFKPPLKYHPPDRMMIVKVTVGVLLKKLDLPGGTGAVAILSHADLLTDPSDVN